MPDPKKYKSKREFMDDCMHQTRKVEKKPQDVSVAQCLSMWGSKNKKKKSKDACEVIDRIAGKLEEDIKKADTAKKPSVFLGGKCEEGNEWRKEIKKEFGDAFFFLDPYDPHWEPDENIYDELAGIANADYTVFYKGGKGSDSEQEFADLVDQEYKEFENLGQLRAYLKRISEPAKKRACISQALYRSAANLMALDLENDAIGGFLKQADDMSGKVHREKEKRIVLNELPKECNGKKPIIIKQGILREAKKDGEVISYARIRMKKEPGKEPQYSLGVKNFPLSQESETQISKQMFDSFYPDFLERPQEKERYKLGNGWDVDVLEDKIVAEYEQKPNEKVSIPNGWNVKEEKSYKMASVYRSSLQIQLPGRIAAKIKALGREIPNKELTADGREEDAHVTVLYGLDATEPDLVKEILKGVEPFTITLRETSPFTESPLFDVVKFDVNSVGIQKLNRLLREKCPYHGTYPNYHPHATVAYVRKGHGAKYAGRKIPGASFVATEVVFSSSNGKKTKIKLGKA